MLGYSSIAPINAMAKYLSEKTIGRSTVDFLSFGSF